MHLYNLNFFKSENSKICSWTSPSSHIAYIGLKKIVQWWKVWRIWWQMMLRVARDDSISKFRSQKWQTLCGNVAACSILLKPIFFPCCNMLDVLPYCVLQNLLQVEQAAMLPHNVCNFCDRNVKIESSLAAAHWSFYVISKCYYLLLFWWSNQSVDLAHGNGTVK